MDKKRRIRQTLSKYKVFFKLYLRNIFYVLLGFFLSFFALRQKDRRYKQPIQDLELEMPSAQCSSWYTLQDQRLKANNSGDIDKMDKILSGVNVCPNPPDLRCYDSAYCYLNTTGIITSHEKPDMYVFEDTQQRDRLFFLPKWRKNLQVGQEIYLFHKGVLAPYEIDKRDNISEQSFFGSGSVVPEYLFDFNKRLMMKGYYGVIFQPSFSLLPTYSFADNLSIVGQARQALTKMIVNVYGETKVSGLFLGMLIGDKSKIPKGDYETFIESNLVHIIAVSGGNIIMLVIFLSFIFVWVPFYFRLLLLIVSVLAYALLCGADSSVIRATVMGSLGLVTLLLGREISLKRSLAYTRVLMLLRNPYMMVYDVGFLLSFGAIVGLVWIDRMVKKRKKETEGAQDMATKLPSSHISTTISSVVGRCKVKCMLFVKEYIFPTLGASLGVLPFLLFFMHKINLTGVVANIFVLPLVPLVMVWGVVSSFLFDRFPALAVESGRRSPIGDSIRLIGQSLIHYIYQMSEFGANIGIFLEVKSPLLRRGILFIGIAWLVRVVLYVPPKETTKNKETAKDTQALSSLL